MTAQYDCSRICRGGRLLLKPGAHIWETNLLPQVLYPILAKIPTYCKRKNDSCKQGFNTHPLLTEQVIGIIEGLASLTGKLKVAAIAL